MASQETANSSGDVQNGTQPVRSILVDANILEEQFLRCQICHERFDQAEHPPKSLPCNHTFCLLCLTQVFDHEQPPGRRNMPWADSTLDGILKCPSCRVEIYLSRNKIRELPNDHRVIQMIDIISQAAPTSPNVCTHHDNQPLNFFCKKCLVPVCRDCTVLDHKEQQGHEIVDAKQALNDSSGDLNQVEGSCRQILERMKARSDALANASKRLEMQERHLGAEIKETFIEYRLLLEKRQEAVMQTLQQKVRAQKALINTRFVNLDEQGTQLQKLFDAFLQAKSSSNLQQLFAVKKQLKDNEDQLRVVAIAEDNELFKSCVYEPTAEAMFLSEISSLGEVSIKDDLTLKEPLTAQQLRTLNIEEERERELNDIGLYFGSDAGNYESDDPDVDLEELAAAERRGIEEYSLALNRVMARYGDYSSRRLEEMDNEDSPVHTHRRSAQFRRPRQQNYIQNLTSNFATSIPPERPPIPAVQAGSSNHSRSNSRSRRSGPNQHQRSPNQQQRSPNLQERSPNQQNYRVVRHNPQSILQPTDD